MSLNINSVYRATERQIDIIGPVLNHLIRADQRYRQAFKLRQLAAEHLLDMGIGQTG